MLHKVKTLIKYLRRILKDTDGKPSAEITADLAKLFAKHRSFRALRFYVHNLMFKRESGNINDYVMTPNKIVHQKYHQEKDEGKASIFINKADFIEYLANNNLPTTTFIGKIKDQTFFGDETTRSIRNRSQLKEVFHMLLEDHPSFFLKKANSGNGREVYKIDKHSIDLIDPIDLESNYVIEKTIIQHEALSSINPNCVNTLKVITYRKGDNICFPNCYFRMGVGEAHLDNVKYGGFFIKYDIDANKLDKVGYTYMNYGGTSYYKHPDTNYVFEGKGLIYAEEIKKVLTKAALLFDGPLIGWDIAYSVDGPIIIEGSLNPNLRKTQITSKGLLSNPIYGNILNQGNPSGAIPK
jgi:hypothetical protein